jgi:hypothetical protein
MKEFEFSNNGNPDQRRIQEHLSNSIERAVTKI